VQDGQIQPAAELERLDRFASQRTQGGDNTADVEKLAKRQRRLCRSRSKSPGFSYVEEAKFSAWYAE
jgi:hypothetical protein